jgi:hypothetical protein
MEVMGRKFVIFRKRMGHGGRWWNMWCHMKKRRIINPLSNTKVRVLRVIIPIVID